MQTSPKLEAILQSGYEFHFGEYLSRGWDIFRQGIWSFAGFTLLYFAIQMGLSLIPFLGSIASTLVLAPLQAGYFIMAHRIAKREKAEFQDFFKGFDWIAPLVLKSVIQFVAIIALLAPIGFTLFKYFLQGDIAEQWLSGNFDFSPHPLAFLTVLPLIYLLVSWRWAPMLIIFYNMNFWDAMETSRRLLTRKWGLFFLFYLVAGIIAVSGILLLVVGVLFSLAFFYCADYAAFADVTRLYENEKEDITEHLVGA